MFIYAYGVTIEVSRPEDVDRFDNQKKPNLKIRDFK